MQQIVECDFQIAVCQNRQNRSEKIGSYKIYIHFYSDAEKQHLVSRKKLTITKDHPEMPLLGKPVFDVYSYNGVSTSKPSKLLNERNFSTTTLEECHATLDIFKRTKVSESQVLFVLDLKNFPQHENDKNYSHRSSIEDSEAKLLSFLKIGHAKSSQQANLFREMLFSIPLSYVILEGRLKATFIEDDFFSEAEKIFLQTRGIGCQSFCQIIEFFLNAFKRGESVTCKTNLSSGEIKRKTYDRTPYIQKIDETQPDYEPADISHTIYPPAYYEIATQGIYAMSMSRSTLFHTQTTIHPNQVVEMATFKNPENGL